MADNKRKQGPGGTSNGSAPKRSKGGSAGRWKTPHHQAKLSHRVEMGKTLEVGDQGIWVTYARGMKTKAIREIDELCQEYGESLYGIPRDPGPGEDQTREEDGEDGGPADIEASIQKELSDMKPAKAESRKIFSIVPADVECLLFIKTMAPVEPVEFVRKICQDARDCTDIMQRKTKYINRLTPISTTDKASDSGIVRAARAAMAPYFDLVKVEGQDESSGPDAGEESKKEKNEGSGPKYAYAIRQSIRVNITVKSDALIKKVASLVQPEHKVNLTKPDKVVLVHVYQMLCGVSVVDGAEWESLKRYNMNELYLQAAEKQKEARKTEGNTAPA
ncbi:tRNA acetyltransferase-like protein [Hapsidospora chrysogenum ATCC 11550]|uniref:tRNA acetyltransferase-like protein n=1 Tax=Hapsidospora chrysogenum (strain ATCC 11550 / CBS 779.69 / DSM 880 / IAM 14645 / JCM 23072 / IMI 49137) TaxID=857340 RepID=A0A086T0P1_HAPC1|nr:tRNA acetyltransferase-like protein [Hapsidospora chrysogenum ATCC 11550]